MVNGIAQLAGITAADRCMTMGEVGAVLRISRQQVGIYIRRGELAAIRLGRRKVVQSADLLAFLQRHRG